MSDLLPGWKWIGKGRDDGNKKGEFSAILYQEDKFEVQSWDTFWLSPSPGIPSKGWDAALNRTATWALMKIKDTGRLIFFINTHFDHIGKEARKKSAELLLSQIKELVSELWKYRNITDYAMPILKNKEKYKNAGPVLAYPIVLTGDFNDTTLSEPYNLLASYLNDSRKISLTDPQGPEFSFNGFNSDIDSGDMIDYIFVKGNINVKEHRIIAEKFNGRYPSDHFPVSAVIEFKNFK